MQSNHPLNTVTKVTGPMLSLHVKCWAAGEQWGKMQGEGNQFTQHDCSFVIDDLYQYQLWFVINNSCTTAPVKNNMENSTTLWSVKRSTMLMFICFLTYKKWQFCNSHTLPTHKYILLLGDKSCIVPLKNSQGRWINGQWNMSYCILLHISWWCSSKTLIACRVVK